MNKALLIFLLLSQVTLYGQSTPNQKNNQKFKQAYLDKVYGHMSNDQYDSAQYQLNKIYQTDSARKPSLFNYYVTIYQAEVYYYNNLHRVVCRFL